MTRVPGIFLIRGGMLTGKEFLSIPRVFFFFFSLFIYFVDIYLAFTVRRYFFPFFVRLLLLFTRVYIIIYNRFKIPFIFTLRSILFLLTSSKRIFYECFFFSFLSSFFHQFINRLKSIDNLSGWK